MAGKKFGFKDIRQHHWSTIQYLAKKRKIEFTISVDYAWGIFVKQKKKCALSGIDIEFAKTKKEHATGETTASLDRIDSSKGYIEDNIQWLHKWVNLMKSDFVEKEFIEFCRQITNFTEAKNEQNSARF